MLWAILLAFFSSPLAQAKDASAPASSQTGLIDEAARLNHTNSDKSLQSSTVLAMKALGQLANYNIPGALSNGYDAYGKYVNSVHMDNLEFANKHNAWQMSSVTGGVPGPEPKLFYTSYSRLDPKFLEQGDTAKASEEFEKATGMKAKKLLQVMGYFADNPIHPSDPEIFKKMKKQADYVIGKLPDSTLTTSLKKVQESVPDNLKTDALNTLLAKFWKDKPALGAKITVEANLAKATDTSTGASSLPGEANRAPAESPKSEYPEGTIFPLEAKPNADPNLASVFQMAGPGKEDEDKSLFVRVSSKIRGKWKDF